jgi:hypothetical protein
LAQVSVIIYAENGDNLNISTEEIVATMRFNDTCSEVFHVNTLKSFQFRKAGEYTMIFEYCGLSQSKTVLCTSAQPHELACGSVGPVVVTDTGVFLKNPCLEVKLLDSYVNEIKHFDQVHAIACILVIGSL